MLSRIPESLFWVGRYVERAECTARMLEVHVLRLLEDAGAGESADCRDLLSVVGAAPAHASTDLGTTVDSHQTALTTSVETRPGTRPRRYRDWYGTQVHAFDLHEPHESLEVVGRSVVEVDERPGPGEEAVVPSWAELRSPGVQDAFAEHLFATQATPGDEELRTRAREGADAADAVVAVSEAVRGHLAYRPGTTGVATTAPQAWAAASGVCQDFAHVALVGLRGLGLPARYVSGYLHPAAEVRVGTTGVGESHAWVEVWLGAWSAYDVTNGSVTSGMGVAVEIERLR